MPTLNGTEISYNLVCVNSIFFLSDHEKNDVEAAERGTFSDRSPVGFMVKDTAVWGVNLWCPQMMQKLLSLQKEI